MTSLPTFHHTEADQTMLLKGMVKVRHTSNHRVVAICRDETEAQDLIFILNAINRRSDNMLRAARREKRDG